MSQFSRHKPRLRSVFISDIHLGTRECQDRELLAFLRSVSMEKLFLVGDVVDLWSMRRRIYWPASHQEVLREIVSKARSGTQVIYIPGNHDELFRGHIGTVFNGIEIRERAVHETADRRRFLVLHGDEFDGVVCSSRWLAVLGSEAYDFLIEVNRWFNQFRRVLGFPYWSMSAYIKHKVKNAVNFIFDFEEALLHAAREEQLDGVICGHIHHPAIRETEHGIRYCNCGDWVESCTALAESHQGELSIIRWVEESVQLLEESALENCPDHGRLAPTN